MPKIWLICFCIMLQLGLVSVSSAADTVPILCYHGVGKADADPYMVTKETLNNHFAYLREHGYHPISLQQYIAFARDGAALPDKPVMITFDDGYISFYKDVFPLLKQYNYPAMLSIVGFWMEYPPPEVGVVVNWNQLREMEASGLVTIASHSYKSHYFQRVNPQGDRGYVLADRAYGASGYETEENFQQRVADDLRQAQQQFERELGHKAAALVWPYGAYNAAGIAIAQKMGFQAAFTLGAGRNEAGLQGLWQARRALVVDKPDSAAFAAVLQTGSKEKKPVKVVSLTIDTIYEPDNLRTTDSNLQMIISRFKKNGVSTIYLQALSIDKTTEHLESAYFYTDALPVKADIFSHIAAKLRKEKFSVYAVMPSLSQKQITALYTDLATHTYVDGVFFQDDLYLTQQEDVESLTEQVMREFRKARPLTLFARAIPAETVVSAADGANTSQYYQRYLNLYDYCVITPPTDSGVWSGAAQQRLETFAAKALAEPAATGKVIFQLETFDFAKQTWHTSQEIKQKVHLLRGKGALYFYYYPDSQF